MKNSGMDSKASIVTIIFYILIICILPMSQWLDEQASWSYTWGYRYGSIYMKAFGFLLLGGLVVFLARRPKDSKRTFILELVVIGIPSLLMANILAIYYLIPIGSSIIGHIFLEITLIGAILLGCEIYRSIIWIRQNKINAKPQN